MRDHRLDAGEVVVGGGLRQGENEAGVENVQALVLHRAHIEVIDGDDVENVQEVFAPVGVLVPLHRAFERAHCVVAFILIPRADPDVQLDLAARHGAEEIGVVGQVARDKREEIGGFGPGVAPFGKAGAGLGGVAVGQKHRLVAFDADVKGGHHIGAVGVEGDLAKPFGLALGAVHAARHVEPFQCGVGFGRNLDLGREQEGTGGQHARGDRQASGVGGQRHRLTVDGG
ncbi:hypothetical protein GALL_547720 [mine drainage metagenome]|uniref:Uncharacterized protein n=1 Tax=mine drainage metagenome TaxID=410659 RepID=A0A1J5P7C5_9ZZZZ